MKIVSWEQSMALLFFYDLSVKVFLCVGAECTVSSGKIDLLTVIEVNFILINSFYFDFPPLRDF